MKPATGPDRALIEPQPKGQVSDACKQLIAVDQGKTQGKAQGYIEEKFAQRGGRFPGLPTATLDKTPVQEKDQGGHDQHPSGARQLLARKTIGVDLIQGWRNPQPTTPKPPALKPEFSQDAQQPVQAKERGDITDEGDQVEI